MNTLEIANQIKNLMEENGIVKRRQAKELSRILGITYSAATRKMKGEFPWSTKQIESVAKEYGENPADLVIAQEEGKPSAFKKKCTAILVLDEEHISCSAWIGEQLHHKNFPQFVATIQSDRWHVYLGRKAPSEQLFNVELIKITPTLKAPHIAVVDDHENSADSLCDYLNAHGFVASAYYCKNAFQLAFDQKIFDAYVIDWLLADTTAEENIKNIRKQGNAPIFLLTGELITGKVSESDIAHVISKYNVTHFEKPIRSSLLFAELSKALKLRGISKQKLNNANNIFD